LDRTRTALGRTTAAVFILLIILSGVGGYFVGTSYVGSKVTTAQAAPFKIGLITLSEGATSTWTRAHTSGLMAAINQFNSTAAPIQIVLERFDVTEADAVQVLTNLASSGTNLIIAAAVNYEPMVRQVAPKYPNVKFLSCCWANSSGLPPNVSLYGWDVWEGYYPAGVVAGSVTKTNVIGFVTAFGFPVSAAAFNAFLAGAQSVNPNVKGVYAFTQDWGDPVKGANAANALISKGADVLIGMGDGMTDGVIRAAQHQGKLAMGYIWDENDLAPNTVVTSVVWHTEAYWVSAITAYYSGTFGGQYWTYGIKDGIVTLSQFHSFNITITSQTKQTLDTFFANVKSGASTVPFNGTYPPSS
jgi:basic membrane lipoprotein Med (substrate-binding protein (PBP1-ABC) superfamily)